MIANAHRLAMILVMIVFFVAYYVFVLNPSNHSAISLYWVYMLALPAALHSLLQLKAS